jgi:hypothetical protein
VDGGTAVVGKVQRSTHADLGERRGVGVEEQKARHQRGMEVNLDAPVDN